jgi:RHS repeat-associated protein
MVWDMTEELSLILSDTTNSYIYGPGGMPIEQISSGGTVTYLHHDQQGSTRLLTGSTGTVTGKCTYGAYGTLTCEGATTTPLGYDGQYTSADTGLIYMRGRVYDPATAQFLTVDPLEVITGAPYSYVGDNPLNEIDPTGLGDWLGLGIPSPGEILEPLNPYKYYEEEAESYENGCGYFASVAHGVEGAVVATLDATGASDVAEGIAGLAPNANWGVLRTLISDETGAVGRYGNLGNLAGQAEDTVADVIRSRGGGASQVNQLQSGYGELTLGEVSELAASGDREAEAALKMVKQAGSQGKGGK